MIKNATFAEVRETISDLHLPSSHDDTVYVTRSSLIDRLSRVLYQFENYNYSIMESEIRGLLQEQPYLSSIASTDYPIYAIGFLRGNCTATLIGPYHAITSAECVYNHTTKEWKTDLTLLRGRKCDTFLQSMYWESVSVPYEYIYNGHEDYNWAYIQYDRSYKSPVWLSMTYNSQLFDEFTPVALTGYSPSAPDGCPFSTPCLLATSSNSNRFSSMGCDVPIPFPGGAILADNNLSNIPPIIAISQGRNVQLTDVSKITKDMYWLLCHWMKKSGYDPENKQRSDDAGIVVLVPKLKNI